MSTRTIAAISTALNHSGIGIVRISGSDAISIADRMFVSPSGKKLKDAKSHTIHYGHIVENDTIIDEVLVMLMKAPHTYTTEDTVEINCHGGVYVVKRVLEVALNQGATLAEPGEFTKKAFLGGRMDLSQAEAVMDLIQSQNEYAREASVRQLRGNLSDKVKNLRSEILYQIAYVESALDDPEHISLDGYTENLIPNLIQWKEEIEKMILSFENGRRMTEGIKTVIVGKPNAGKSSILNLLVGEERAIVTDVAGTTRDVLEENISLNGISIILLDTAGIRKTEDVVEQIGVKRARQHAEEADLILYIVDCSNGLDENDEDILKQIQGKEIIVLMNKMDLYKVSPSHEQGDLKEEQNEKIQSIVTVLKDKYNITNPIWFSAKEQTGLEELTDRISEIFFAGKISNNDQIYITNVRHRDLLKKALENLTLVENSIQNGMPEDFYSIDLMDAYTNLGLIIGEEVEDDLVNEIFHRFCMGK
jgi:tRNA modification GTPase